MGRIENTKLLPEYLSLLFDEVPTQDMHTGATALATNSTTRPGLWKHIQTNFDLIKEKLGANMTVFDRFLSRSLEHFNDRETEKEIAKFFEGRDNKGYDRTLNVVSDKIKGGAAYKERDAEVIIEWLKTHRYV